MDFLNSFHLYMLMACFVLAFCLYIKENMKASEYRASPGHPGVIYDKRIHFPWMAKLFGLFALLVCASSIYLAIAVFYMDITSPLPSTFISIFTYSRHVGFFIGVVLVLIMIAEVYWSNQRAPVDRVLDYENYLLCAKGNIRERIPLDAIDQVILFRRDNYIRAFFRLRGAAGDDTESIAILRSNGRPSDIMPPPRSLWSNNNWVARFYFRKPGIFGAMIEFRASREVLRRNPPLPSWVWDFRQRMGAGEPPLF